MVLFNDSRMEIAIMKAFVLLGFIAAPFVIGGIAAGNTEGAANLCAVMFLSLLMVRESAQICLLLMRRWQIFEQDSLLLTMLPAYLIEAELRPVRVKQENVFRRDIYHRR